MSEKEHAIGQAALNQLRQLGVPATPRNYELFYRALEGQNMDLTRALKALHEQERLDDPSVLDDLYQTHLAPHTMTEMMLEIGDRLNESMLRISGITETAANEQGVFGAAMAKLHARLQQIEDPMKLVETIEQIASASSGMQKKTMSSSELLEQMAAQISDLRGKIQVVQEESLTDELTGIGNRRLFQRILHEQWSQSDGVERPLTLVMVDVDHFKAFNDKHGHPTGDRALKHIAGLLDSHLKGRGTVCRYGGEEFAIIMPGLLNIDAMPIIEKIRKELTHTHLIRRDSKEKIGSITASFGVAGREKDETPDDLVFRADKNLYDAKSRGRNKVVGDLAQDPTFGPKVEHIQRIVKSAQEPAGSGSPRR